MTMIMHSAPAAATTAGADTAPAANGPDAALLAALPVAGAGASADGALPALFAQLLNQAGLALPGDTLPADASPADAAPADADGKSDSSSDAAAPAPVATAPADAGTALPAMVTSMLAMAVPPPVAPLSAPVTGSNGDSGDQGAQPRVDPAGALNTTSMLNNSSTRLNLAAAGVAVMPAASAPAGAPATAPAAAAGYVPASDTGTAQPAAADTAPTPTPTPAPGAANAAALPSAPITVSVAAANVAQPVPRSTTRSGDDGAPSGDSQRGTPAAPASAAPLGASKDDGLAGTTRVTAAPTPSGVNGSYAQQAAPQTPANATVKLAGTPEQWQQPLREALGDRLQLQLQRNDNQAVIRLDPPNMGRIEISIRHSDGALQVNLSANNSEVLRQLNSIGDSVRQDLSQRQFSEVAVTVSAARAGQGQGQADADGRGRQQRDAEDGRTPGRALSEDDSAAGSFAMLTERE